MKLFELFYDRAKMHEEIGDLVKQLAASKLKVAQLEAKVSVIIRTAKTLHEENKTLKADVRRIKEENSQANELNQMTEKFFSKLNELATKAKSKN